MEELPVGAADVLRRATQYAEEEPRETERAHAGRHDRHTQRAESFGG